MRVIQVLRMKENTKRNTGITPVAASPKKRTILSFEPDDDINAMLTVARSRGISLVHMCNKALRPYLTANGYAKKQSASR